MTELHLCSYCSFSADASRGLRIAAVLTGLMGPHPATDTLPRALPAGDEARITARLEACVHERLMH
jgi:hypothetical protein